MSSTLPLSAKAAESTAVYVASDAEVHFNQTVELLLPALADQQTANSELKESNESAQVKTSANGNSRDLIYQNSFTVLWIPSTKAST